mmetsp:Transcript_2072/g.4827  ORF Transcript_2072/g.4827 Transcript_2072/m.4827 type:complete len:97 (+) Transcript_2072:500-790(+)
MKQQSGREKKLVFEMLACIFSNDRELAVGMQLPASTNRSLALESGNAAAQCGFDIVQKESLQRQATAKTHSPHLLLYGRDTGRFFARLQSARCRIC